MGLIFALFLIGAAGVAAYVDLTQTPGFDPATFSLFSLNGPTSPAPAKPSAPPPAPAPVREAPAPTDDHNV